MKRLLIAPLAIAALLGASFLPVHAQDKKPMATQASVASKTAKFATVKATDPSVKKAVAATSLDTVMKSVGKSITVVGTVDAVYVPKSNSIVILNFAKEYWTAATAALKAKDYAAFPNMQQLKGKKVLITGTVKEYKEKPEIELLKPAQIKIIN
jgi:DNA/RNA endonuclease YhcR with UshA esterase domain